MIEEGSAVVADAGRPLSMEDFTIKEYKHQKREAIQILSPVFFAINTYNKDGDVFSLMGINYDGSTTTPKGQLTRAIMDTFTVLD
jgi:hypothetical protein